MIARPIAECDGAHLGINPGQKKPRLAGFQSLSTDTGLSRMDINVQT
jgi:hypothetical protein